MDRERRRAVLRTLIFTVLVPGTATIVLPRAVVASDAGADGPTGGPLDALGLLLIVTGIAGYLRCAFAFAIEGRGTPAPIDPPKELVVRGLYRYVRNPMYVSVLLVVVGEVIFLRSTFLAIYAAALGFLFHTFAVLYEEPTLLATFGKSYERYRRDVPRWIPRPRR